MKKKSKKTLNRIRLKEWAVIVKTHADFKCEICGKPASDAHHVISRHILKTRYDVLNGVALCKFHHKFAKVEASAHGCPLLFYEWMRTHKIGQYQYLLQALKIK